MAGVEGPAVAFRGLVSGHQFTHAANRPPIFRETKYAAQPRSSPGAHNKESLPHPSLVSGAGWDTTIATEGPLGFSPTKTRPPILEETYAAKPRSNLSPGADAFTSQALSQAAPRDQSNLAERIGGHPSIKRISKGQIGLCRDQSCWTVGFYLLIGVRYLPDPKERGARGTLGVVFGASRPRPPARHAGMDATGPAL